MKSKSGALDGVGPRSWLLVEVPSGPRLGGLKAVAEEGRYNVAMAACIDQPRMQGPGGRCSSRKACRMIDRPDMSGLLRAMGETLSREVVPATRGGAQHAARVIANLCRILEREAELGAEAARAAQQDLAQLLEREGTLPELAAILDERLRQDAETPGGSGASVAAKSFEADAHAVLLADVKRRLVIDRPGYDE